MNIFFLDSEPEIAAQMQCDKHVVKMVLESAQLLCTCHHELGCDKTPPDSFYRATHKHHPCQLWIQECLPNYLWLASHALALAEEYTYRYEKRHKSQDIIEWCVDNPPNHYHPDPSSLNRKTYGSWFITPPAQAMPDEFRNFHPVKAYREYYYYNKRVTIDMRWTKRDKPEWWKEREASDEL